MKVIGFRNVDFTGQDGRPVRGLSLYLSKPITKDGSGETVEKVFLSERILNSMEAIPALGEEVEPVYNRFGKVVEVRPV
jgi:hypothetical protein